VDAPTRPLTSLPESFEKPAPVRIILEDVLPSIPATHHGQFGVKAKNRDRWER